MEKLQRIYGVLLKNSTKVFAAIFAVFLLMTSFLFTSLMDTDETTYYKKDLWYVNIIVLILFFGCVQLFCIGIIGEYVGRTFEQSKSRPVYIAKEILDYEERA